VANRKYFALQHRAQIVVVYHIKVNKFICVRCDPRWWIFLDHHLGSHLTQINLFTLIWYTTTIWAMCVAMQNIYDLPLNLAHIYLFSFYHFCGVNAI